MTIERTSDGTVDKAITYPIIKPEVNFCAVANEPFCALIT